MKVLFVDQFSDLGGAQMVLRDVLSEGMRRGWQAEFMAPGGGALFNFCRDHGIPAHPLPLGRYANGRKTWSQTLLYGPDMLRAALAVRARPFDLVMVNGPRLWPAAIGVSCPVVFHLHSRLDKGYARFICRRAAKHARATVVAVSQFVADPELSPRVIYNGVSDLGFRSNRAHNGPARIGIVGRISPEKGHLDFVHAARILAARDLSVRFEVYGAALFSDWSYETEVRQAAGSAVEFHGWTDHIGEVLHELDILVVPSSAIESTPRVIMEAMSAGTPVVAYPSGGIPELLRDGDTGILTGERSPEALGNAIEGLLTAPVLMNALPHRARREWDARFRLERFQREFCDLLDQTAHRSAKKSGQTKAAIAVAGEHDLA